MPLGPFGWTMNLKLLEGDYRVYTVHTCPLDGVGLHSLLVQADGARVVFNPSYPMSYRTCRHVENALKTSGPQPTNCRLPDLNPFELTGPRDLTASLAAQLRNLCFPTLPPEEHDGATLVQTVQSRVREGVLLEFVDEGRAAGLRRGDGKRRRLTIDQCSPPVQELTVHGRRVSMVPCSMVCTWMALSALAKVFHALRQKDNEGVDHLVVFVEDPSMVQDQTLVVERGTWTTTAFYKSRPEPWCDHLDRSFKCYNALLTKTPEHAFSPSDERRRSQIVVIRTKRMQETGVQCVKVVHLPPDDMQPGDRWEVTVVPLLRSNQQMKMCSQSMWRRQPYTETPFVLEGDDLAWELGAALVRLQDREAGLDADSPNSQVRVRTVCKDTHLINVRHHWNETTQVVPATVDDPMEKHASMSHLLRSAHDLPVDLHHYHMSVFLNPRLCSALGACLQDVVQRARLFAAEVSATNRDSGCEFDEAEEEARVQEALTRRGRSAYVFLGCDPHQTSDAVIHQYFDASIAEAFKKEHDDRSGTRWNTWELHRAMLQRGWDEEKDDEVYFRY